MGATKLFEVTNECMYDAQFTLDGLYRNYNGLTALYRSAMLHVVNDRYCWLFNKGYQSVSF